MVISLIIPIYNVEKYIADCLRSLMVQTYDNFECILVDDKTPDNSMEIAYQMISDYHGNIQFRVIHHDNNMGLPNARNTGIKNAIGDYLLFLDSDDTLTTDCIETMISLTEKNTNIDLVQCGINERSSIFDVSKLPACCIGCHNIFREFLIMHIPWTVHGKLVRKSFLLEKNLLFDEDILIHEDLYWTYFLCRATETFVFSPHIVYNYNTTNVDSIMRQSEMRFERSAHYYLIIIDRLFSNIDINNYVENRIFIENLLFYVGTTIYRSCEITPNTLFSFMQLRRRMLKDSIRNKNLPEFFYLLHLYKPLIKLIRFSWYRRNMYLYEKAIRLCYGKN